MTNLPASVAAAPAPDEVSEPAEPEVRALLEAYIAAFENADPAAMERVLRKDAALEPVGSATWFAGRETCLRFITQFLGAPGDWRMIATRANGQPAAAAYLRGRDGTHRAFGIAVLAATSWASLASSSSAIPASSPSSASRRCYELRAGRFTGTPTSRSCRWLGAQVVTSPTVNVAAGRVAGVLD